MKNSDSYSIVKQDDFLNRQYIFAELETWKETVEKDISNLRKRVNQLENRGCDSEQISKVTAVDCSKSTPRPVSFATAEDDGFAGIFTCVRLIRSNKIATFQCFWLVVFFAILLAIAAHELLRAMANTNAEWKPEKKYQTIDYGNTEKNTAYEMPYIYIYFYGAYEVYNDWLVDNMLEDMLFQQDYFENKTYIRYVDSGCMTLVTKAWPVVEATALYTDTPSEVGFHGFFRLLLSNPDPGLGSFQFGVKFDMKSFNVTGLVSLSGFFVSISRVKTNTSLGDVIHVPIENSMFPLSSYISATVDYEERVIHTWSDEYVEHFDMSLKLYDEKQISELSSSNDMVDNGVDGIVDDGVDGIVDNVVDDGVDRIADNTVDDTFEGMVDITFGGNLMVEYWEEYVEYGYMDFCSAMGGYVSIASIIFFWGAYLIAVSFGANNTMGILPEISFVFANFECIQTIRDKIKRQ